MMTKLRVLLAEDHETVREGLKLIINAQSDMEVIAEASDGLAAIQRAQELSPDVLIMDVSMPKLNGLRATKKLKEVCPQVKVVALTRHNDESYLQELLRAGASGYVLKQSPTTEMLHAIRTVGAGNSYLDPAVTGRVMSRYAGRLDRRDQRPANCTDRELEVLKAIAWGYSNKEIAAHMKLSVKTIEAHKANCMKKLDLHSRIDIVRYAVLQGWLESD
jgi:two-component system, NarL family, response regulator NreC